MKKILVIVGALAAVAALTACSDPGPSFEEQCEALGGTVISQTDTVYVYGSKGAGFASVEDRDCVGVDE